jgi:hypothetical protein
MKWTTVDTDFIRAPEDVCHMRVLEVYQAHVRLEDDKCYLSVGWIPKIGEVVMAHVPWDAYGYITPA